MYTIRTSCRHYACRIGCCFNASNGGAVARQNRTHEIVDRSGCLTLRHAQNKPISRYNCKYQTEMIEVAKNNCFGDAVVDGEGRRRADWAVIVDPKLWSNQFESTRMLSEKKRMFVINSFRNQIVMFHFRQNHNTETHHLVKRINYCVLALIYSIHIYHSTWIFNPDRMEFRFKLFNNKISKLIITKTKSKCASESSNRCPRARASASAINTNVKMTMKHKICHPTNERIANEYV